MSVCEASHAAPATAYMRAAHPLLDPKPLVRDDPIPVQIPGKGARLHPLFMPIVRHSIF